MNKALACAFAMVVSAVATGCGDKGSSADIVGAPTPPEAPSGTLLSNPLRAPVTTNSGGVSLGVSGETFAYASAAPGTFPDAASASIRNTTQKSAAQAIDLRDGGFDPVAVAATSGDELSLTLKTNRGGETTFALKVPPRKPPQLVRTSPAKGRVDVAMSVQILIVFSEPVDPSTLTPGSIVFRRSGEDASATIVVSSDRLSAQLVPAIPLEPETSYQFEIKQTILDLDGDALANPSTVDFVTGSPGPKGSLILTDEADRNIYSINADGSDMRQLSTGNRDFRAQYSPDGQRIAFLRNYANAMNRGFGTSDVFIMNADGSNVVRRTVDAFFLSVAWSPDGKKLLLSDEDVYEAHIYIMSADDDGTSPTLLTSDGRSPKWSPDGRKIAFVNTSGDDGYHQISVMDPDGSNERALTVIDPGGIFGVTWSPDGTLIAFSKCLSGEGCNIYVMNEDGSNLHMLAAVGTARDLTWSPDGRWIAFTANDIPSIKYISSTGGAARWVAMGAYNPSWKP